MSRAASEPEAPRTLGTILRRPRFVATSSHVDALLRNHFFERQMRALSAEIIAEVLADKAKRGRAKRGTAHSAHAE